MTVFDEATAVLPAGDGRYDVKPDERFAIISADGTAVGAVNGGVLTATVLRAVLDSSPHPHPVATSTHFLRVPRPEPAQVEVTWLKQGRTAATARASLIQDGAPVLETTVTTGRLGPTEGDTGLSWTGEPPRLPPIEECLGFGKAAKRTQFRGFAAQVDLRLDPATAGWLRGEPAGTPEMRGYFQLREDRHPDAYLLALAVDALPPVVFGLGAVGWAPTVELTWYMRAVPAAGVLQVAARCRHVSSGWFDEESEVWDSAGRLVAQSRQIARIGRVGRGSPAGSPAPGA
jgi:acyl-coenzyme A thioesterase PaaI-like protein